MTRSAEALINPELLLWARDTSGLTIEEAASRIKVSAARLQEWESGESRPTVKQLREAARVYKRPFAAFYLPEPPKGFRVPHDYRTVGDSGSVRMSPELMFALRRARFLREVALELEKDSEHQTFDLLGAASINDDIEGVAYRVRTTLGVEVSAQIQWTGRYTPFNEWRRAIETSNALVIQFEGVEVEETRAFSIPHRQFPVIAVNGNDHPNARVFSLFHELGHLLLNEDGICNFEESPKARNHDQRTERWCNEFAAAVLVPAERLREVLQVSKNDRRQWEPDELKQPAELFGVSREVIHRRLVSLKLSTFDLHMAMQEKLKQEVAQKVKRDKKGGWMTPSQGAVRRVGPAFARIVFDAYDRQEITTADVTEYLGVRSKHITEIRRLAFTTHGEGVLN